MPTWVVKLGGSLADADSLPLWLDALADAGVVLVPGGGPFADRVRWTQARWGFDDRAAHVMALLAMQQYGWMLSGLCSKWRPVMDADGVAAVIGRGQPALWLPDPDALDAEGIPASWDITSDSLAAWLARKLGAAHLLLIKSAPPPAGEACAETLAAAGLVDAAFPRFTAGAAFTTWLCHRKDHDCLRSGFYSPTAVFTRVFHST